MENEKILSLLRDCPFCHHRPIIKGASWTGIEYIKCGNENCIVKPNTYGKNVDIWNYMSYEAILNVSIHLWNGEIEKIDINLIKNETLKDMLGLVEMKNDKSCFYCEGEKKKYLSKEGNTCCPNCKRNIIEE